MYVGSPFIINHSLYQILLCATLNLFGFFYCIISVDNKPSNKKFPFYVKVDNNLEVVEVFSQNPELFIVENGPEMQRKVF